MAPFAALLAVAGTLCATSLSAQAQMARAEAIEVRLFLAHTGNFSTPITASSVLWNIIIVSNNEGGEERPSSSTFVRVQVGGVPGSYSRDKSVTLKVTSKGQKVRTEVLRRKLGVFSSKGKQYVGFWLPNTGCEVLDLVASVSSSKEAVKTSVPFACGE